MKLALPVSLLLCCLSLPAIAQLDSSTLRGKYGPPLNREMFRMPAGFDLIVDYGAGNQVCKIQVPALMPSNEKVQRAEDMRRRKYDFLADLVPASMRGDKVQQLVQSVSAISFDITQYQHVTIVEVEHANDPFGKDNTITVTFKNENCR